MRQRLFLFACIVAAMFALSTCENPQVIELLRAPTELAFLDVVAYADDFPLTGGATLAPSLHPGLFEYTVYVAKDATRFEIDAGIGAAGSVEVYNVEEQRTGTVFDYVGDEPKVIIVTVQREYMSKAEYLLHVERADMVPPAEDVKITVDPPIGAFFIGRGILPKIEVTANLPAAGGELTYQWYVNSANNTRDGFHVSGATDSSYTMKHGETQTVRTIYYYAEITNTIDGKTGVTVSPPCAVTFINKNELHPKSLAMVDIPAGAVNGTTVTWGLGDSRLTDGGPYSYPLTWETDGFSLGQYPVTWELWETVFTYADAANYRFSRTGNQGGALNSGTNTNLNHQSVGTRLNPVSNVGWRDVVVWCNAYSEMDGKEPVYKDSEGNVLRNSRMEVENLIDTGKMTGDGYRLPTNAEWLYAARGANPTATAWQYSYPGTDAINELKEYIWSCSPELAANGGNEQTTEVGRMKPNTAGLYDMYGMVNEWVWWLDATGLSDTGQMIDNASFVCVILGMNFSIYIPDMSFGLDSYTFIMWLPPSLTFNYDSSDRNFCGLRIAQGGL